MRVPRTPSMTLGGNNLAQQTQNIAKALSANLSFGNAVDNSDSGQNINGWNQAGTTPVAPNTDFTISHNLGRIPKGFIVFSVDQAAIIYKSPTAWTSTTITLRCNVASVNFQLFIT